MPQARLLEFQRAHQTGGAAGRGQFLIFDAHAARRLLWAMTLQKLRESNPEYLAAATTENAQ